MNPGYVYIMTNSAMPNLIKIGFTKRSPEERRRELSRGTGVPVEFQINYEIYTQDMKGLESQIHLELKHFRLNSNREFFQIDVSQGIEIVRNNANELRLEKSKQINGVNETLEKYESIEILGDLQKIYPKMIRDEITSIRIYQTTLRSYLEVTEENFIVKYEHRNVPLIDQKIHRQDLAFIMGEEYEDLLFNPENSAPKNARIFLEKFDDYSKLICCSEIFNDFGTEFIQNEYFNKKKDLNN